MRSFLKYESNFLHSNDDPQQILHTDTVWRIRRQYRISWAASMDHHISKQTLSTLGSWNQTLREKRLPGIAAQFNGLQVHWV
jgi:hypothetical protein